MPIEVLWKEKKIKKKNFLALTFIQVWIPFQLKIKKKKISFVRLGWKLYKIYLNKLMNVSLSVYMPEKLVC